VFWVNTQKSKRLTNAAFLGNGELLV